jgi:hypothetical protein
MRLDVTILGVNLGRKSAKSVVYTVEECPGCRASDRRPFQVGDFVHKEAGACPKCQSVRHIAMIYSETVKQKPRTFPGFTRGRPGGTEAR